MGRGRNEATEASSRGAEEFEDIRDRTEKATDTHTEDKIDRMKVYQLKGEIRKLNLNTVGKKEDSKNFLKRQLKINTKEDDGITESSGSDEDNDASSEDGKETRKRKNKEQTHAKRSTRRVKFRIKDVDENMAYFTGDDELPIKKWIADFEDTVYNVRKRCNVLEDIEGN
ncbi:uncharacterized protein LOC143362839 [Halictus rubicundus]|uniref:uncharacterized protein LOC143362839 n=1 Tax=Halictus rubicundus TaxID=77578 RepID=UPI004035327F